MEFKYDHVYNIFGIQALYNPDRMGSFDIACIYTTPGHPPCVVINDRINELTKEELKAVMVHELGHYAMGVNHGSYDMNEAYADLYVYMVLGEEGLEELYQGMYRLTDNEAMVNTRIACVDDLAERLSIEGDITLDVPYEDTVAMYNAHFNTLISIN